METELIELVKSIRNRTVIFLLLADHPDMGWLFPTLVEDMFVDIQEAVKYCIKEE